MGPPSPSPGDPRFRPRPPGRNPNISDRPPWREFAIVAATVAGLVWVLYLILGWLAGVAAVRVPADWESRWGDLMVSAAPFPRDDAHPARAPLQALVDALVQPVADQVPPPTVHVVTDATVNAAALPGGHILVFEGLLDDVGSENELAMVLGHEIAHQVHRDHLRQAGRTLLVALAAQVVLGADSAVGRLMSGSAELLDLRYSRDQESRADELALELLSTHYGHVGGAVDFFARHQDSDDAALRLFRSHPLSRDRVRNLRDLAESQGHRWDEPRPRPAWATPDNP